MAINKHPVVITNHGHKQTLCYNTWLLSPTIVINKHPVITIWLLSPTMLINKYSVITTWLLLPTMVDIMIPYILDMDHARKLTFSSYVHLPSINKMF